MLFTNYNAKGKIKEDPSIHNTENRKATLSKFRSVIAAT